MGGSYYSNCMGLILEYVFYCLVPSPQKDSMSNKATKERRQQPGRHVIDVNYNKYRAA